MAREGVPGVWFEKKTSNALRKAYLVLPELRFQLAAAQRVEAKRIEQVSDLKESLQLRKETQADLERKARILVGDAQKARREAEEARSAMGRWYRNPWVWWAAGVASGAIVTTAWLM